MNSKSVWLCLTLVVGCAGICESKAATFQGIGSEDGATGSRVTALSADGSTLTGVSKTAFQWTPSTGFTDLGDAPGLSIGTPLGLSPSGATIVGFANTGDDYNEGAFYWTSATGSVNMGNPMGYTSSRAAGISSAGTVVGYSWMGNDEYNTERPITWNENAGFSPLPNLPNLVFGRAVAISADGSSIAGFELTTTGYKSVLWQNGGTPTVLPPLQFGTTSQATNISPDGKTIVGWGETRNSEEQAFVWTAATGTINLGPAVAMSQAFAVSNNGVVVGQWNLPFGEHAFIYDPIDGMRDLQNVLVAAGLGQALQGWTLTEATGISADGRIMAGTGIDPQGHTEGWIATIPEPSSIIPAGVGLFAIFVTGVMRPAHRSTVLRQRDAHRSL